MNEITGSAKELAVKMGTDYATALHVLNFLKTKGLVKDAGKRKPPGGGRGKPTILFTISDQPLTLNLVATKTPALIPPPVEMGISLTEMETRIGLTVEQALDIVGIKVEQNQPETIPDTLLVKNPEPVQQVA